MTRRLMIAALTWASLTLTAHAQAQVSLGVPGPGAATPTLPDRPAPVTKAAGALERSLRHFGRLTLAEPGLADQVLALNLDARAAFDLVRGQQSVPYGGRLRDPQAVLAAGGGNAFDKASALADLLGRMGYDTRFVAGDAPSAPVTLTCGTGMVDPDHWRLTGLGQAVLARIPVRAGASYHLLHPMLAPVAQTPPDTGPHIWLQVRDGADWVDLDPWLPGTAWGDHPAGQGTALTDLPAPHSVIITLEREVLRDGTLSRDTILDHRLDMPDAAGALTALSFGPVRTGIGQAQTTILSEVVDGASDMVARLIVNDKTIESRPFTTPGQSADGGGFLAEGGAEVTTGLWLTVTSTAPGAPDRAETRTVLDIVPETLRLTPDVPIDAAALLTPAPGARYPAMLEGMQHLVLSNGGASRSLMAARSALQIADLPQVVARLNSGALDPWDMIHASRLEAQRVSLAAEVLIQSRPAHGQTCAVVDRPRVMIWGIVPQDGQHDLRWLDWTLDDVGLIGGDPAEQAAARLWHGNLSAALEKEALLWLARAPADAIPLDSAAMLPVDPSGFGEEQAADQARGFAVLANSGLGKGRWWRLDPATGRADARGVGLGNAWWLSALNFTRSGVATVSEAAQAAAPASESAEMQALFRQAVNQVEGVRAAETERPNCFDNNGYLTLLCNVSIPASIAIGTTVILIEVAVIAAGVDD